MRIMYRIQSESSTGNAPQKTVFKVASYTWTYNYLPCSPRAQLFPSISVTILGKLIDSNSYLTTVGSLLSLFFFSLGKRAPLIKVIISEETEIPLPPSSAALTAVCLTTPWGLHVNPGKSLSSNRNLSVPWDLRDGKSCSGRLSESR